MDRSPCCLASSHRPSTIPSTLHSCHCHMVTGLRTSQTTVPASRPPGQAGLRKTPPEWCRPKRPCISPERHTRADQNMAAGPRCSMVSQMRMTAGGRTGQRRQIGTLQSQTVQAWSATRYRRCRAVPSPPFPATTDRLLGGSPNWACAVRAACTPCRRCTLTLRAGASRRCITSAAWSARPVAGRDGRNDRCIRHWWSRGNYDSPVATDYETRRAELPPGSA